MTEHPAFETLSAYADGAATPAESAALAAHLPSCPACAARLRQIRALARALASSPVPAAPRGLADAILARAPRPSLFARLLDELSAGLSQPAGALAAAALAGVLVFAWTRRGAEAPRPMEVPVEVLAAAHRRYQGAMPLSPREALTPPPEAQLAGGPEVRDVY